MGAAYAIIAKLLGSIASKIGAAMVKKLMSAVSGAEVSQAQLEAFAANLSDNVVELAIAVAMDVNRNDTYAGGYTVDAFKPMIVAANWPDVARSYLYLSVYRAFGGAKGKALWLKTWEHDKALAKLGPMDTSTATDTAPAVAGPSEGISPLVLALVAGGAYMALS